MRTPDVDPAAPQTSEAHSGHALANAPRATGSASPASEPSALSTLAALLNYLDAQKFHPSASHVPPDFRDGYNHALQTVIDRVLTERRFILDGALGGAA